MSTVGVAPGTFTIRLGAPTVCPPDEMGTGAPGVPEIDWYDSVNNPMSNGYVWENPYGTESTLKGAAPSTSTVVLLTAGLLAVGGVLFFAFLPKPHRRRR